MRKENTQKSQIFGSQSTPSKQERKEITHLLLFQTSTVVTEEVQIHQQRLQQPQQQLLLLVPQDRIKIYLFSEFLVSVHHENQVEVYLKKKEMQEVPNQILFEIFSLLNGPDIIHLSLVCKKFHTLG